MTSPQEHSYRTSNATTGVVAVIAAVAAVMAVTACGSASTQTVTQSAPAPTPTVTQTVTQQAAPTPTAAPAPTPASGGSGGGGNQTMPSDLIGERLDVAESELDASGITYNEVGGGTFGIIVKSNWIVCQTRPTGGAPVPNSGVDLIVNHFSCSGG